MQVVPDLPTFSVDDGFAYRVPDSLPGVEVGSVVRVPLGGRRVRGFVVHTRDEGSVQRTLKDILSVSGDLAVFDRKLLETLRWSAVHYVAPMAVLLGKSAPPNLPRHRRAVEGGAIEAVDSELGRLGSVAAAGRLRTQYLLGAGPWSEPIAALAAPVLAARRNVVVVAPTFVEADGLATALQLHFGPRVVTASSNLPAAENTKAWVRSVSSGGVLVVGTREVEFWPLGDLGLAVVVEEGRRGMKSTQTPTAHVREVLRRRSAVERFGLVFAGAVPTAEVIGSGLEVRTVPGRVWPLVEIVDRSEEPPGGGVVMERTRRALQGMAKRGGSAFVFVSRRGYAPAFRCVACRTVRRCAVCRSGPDRGDTCRRCGAVLGPCVACGAQRFEALGAGIGRVVEELRRSIGDAVAPAPGPAAVLVGTERDLVGLGRMDLAVAVDSDALLLAPHYRASEDALRLLVRVASLIEPGRGNRAIVQTTMPDHPVMEALRHGSPTGFLAGVLEERVASGFPPAGEILAVEMASPPERADADLRSAAEGAGVVLGPAPVGERVRWLVQGRQLHPARVRLRSLVQGWRDAGATVRVDADPIDL